MDDRQTEVLIEIRDLMRQQVANSNTALEGQREALRRQGEAVVRSRKAQRVLLILFSSILGLYVLSLLFPWVMILLAHPWRR